MAGWKLINQISRFVQAGFPADENDENTGGSVQPQHGNILIDLSKLSMLEYLQFEICHDLSI